MKRIFPIILCVGVLLTNTLKAQDFEPLKFEEVVQVQNSPSKDELYIRVKKWITIAFKNSDQVIELDNQEFGELAGHGSLITPGLKNAFGDYGLNGHVRFHISIQVKDGRYKYIIDNFFHECDERTDKGKLLDLGLLTNNPNPPDGMGKGLLFKKGKINYWNEVKEVTTIQIEDVIKEMKEYVSKTTEDNDW